MSQNELPPGEEGQEAPPKKSKKKLIILLVLLLLIIGGGGAAAWFLLQDPNSIVSQFLNGSDEETSESEEVSNEDSTVITEGSTQKRLTATFLTSLPPLTINLADTGSNRYLRIGIDLEATSEQAVNDIQNNHAKIRDAIIILLSSKRYDDIATADGKFTLKHEIISRINQILGAPRIVQIYFTDFVVQ